jgi:mannose-6-phosphate isomerase-like protein (cupin superfamily)
MWQVVVVIQGALMVQRGHGDERVSEGHALFIPALMAHSYESPDGAVVWDFWGSENA